MSATLPSVDVRVPAGQEEGTRSQVLRWLKAIGEPVAEHEPLVELETDKVTVEVAAPGAGVLAEILKHDQEEVAPGDLLGRIAPAVAAQRTGSTDGANASARDVDSRGPEGDVGAPVGSPGSGSAATGGSGPRGESARQLSPAVRRLLAEHSLQPAQVRGTGEGGRITVADVLREVSAPSRASPGAEAAPAQASAASADLARTAAEAPGVDDAASHRVPHSPVRKRIAARMVDSLLHTAPHVTTVFEVDMSEVLAHRQRHREEFARQGVTLTLTAYFALAAVTAIREVPEANSRWTDSALEVYDVIHLGIATAAEAGLVVPVLRHAESLDLLETARGLEDLVRRAREGALAPGDVRGGTFTLSNHGVSGSLLAAPIIIPQPQSAILGLGKLEKRAVVVEEAGQDRIAVRPRCYATLTLDHRVMDGQRANRFLQVFTERLSGWRS